MNQFHDILPGSCIPEAHDESLRQTTALLEEAGRRLDAKLRPEQMGGVLNPLGFCADGYRLSARKYGHACTRPAHAARGAARRRVFWP